MTFNLIHEKWIPVRRQDGTRSIIAPWQVTDNLDGNPITVLDAPRPDFSGALIQFLIGLVQTTMAPKNDGEWRAGLTNPSSPDQLKQSFESVIFAFNLDGDGPRFLQDFSPLEGKEKEIGALLIDAPGKSTVEKNTDFFVKRGLIKGMCRACVTAALFTLQTNAPQGGRGQRTSLRGGGPLTTLIVGDTIWQTIWLNILLENTLDRRLENPQRREKSNVFSWLMPTRTSQNDTGKSTTPLDVHPLHVYWGMPRRIRLTINGLGKGICSVCGELSQSLVGGYITKKHGMDYDGAWLHPLTPYTQIPGEVPNSVKGQPGGVHYRHWLGLVLADQDRGRMPARVVNEFWERQLKWPELHSLLRRGARIWAFGYDVDTMKARCWYEETMPLLQISEDVRSAYEEIAARLVKTAVLIAGNVRRCVKQAMFRRPVDVKGDLSLIDASFWRITESDFYLLLEQCRAKLRTGAELTSLKLEWLKTLKVAGDQIFDEWSQNNQLEAADSRRIALAAIELRRLNAQGNKKVREILDLPKSIGFKNPPPSSIAVTQAI